MAQSGRANISADDLLGNDGTLRNALELWLAKHGKPVMYQTWQSAWYRLKGEFGMSDVDKPPNEDKSGEGRRSREMYEEVQTEMFGEDHRHQAILGKPHPAVQRQRAEDILARKVGGLRPGQAAEQPPRTSSQERLAHPQPQPQETGLQRGVDADASSLLLKDQVHPGGGAVHHEISTPRRGQDLPEPSPASPDSPKRCNYA